MALPDRPLPPELAAPEDSDWVADLVAFAIDYAADNDATPADVAAGLAAGHMGRLATDHPPAEWAPWDRFEITDLAGAEWAMRHVAQAEAELAQLRLQADDWAARIQAWFDHAAQRPGATAAFFGAHLERYALAERVRTGDKVKSIATPAGVVKTTASSRRPELAADQEAVIDWARTWAPDAITTTERVLISDLAPMLRIVDRVTDADVVRSCGCTDRVLAEPGQWVDVPDVGTASACPVCGEDALVGQVHVHDSWPQLIDASGQPVPATVAQVRPARTTAKVVPA